LEGGGVLPLNVAYPRNGNRLTQEGIRRPSEMFSDGLLMLALHVI
jgi:hypothetical protein